MAFGRLRKRLHKIGLLLIVQLTCARLHNGQELSLTEKNDTLFFKKVLWKHNLIWTLPIQAAF